MVIGCKSLSNSQHTHYIDSLIKYNKVTVLKIKIKWAKKCLYELNVICFIILDQKRAYTNHISETHTHKSFVLHDA